MPRSNEIIRTPANRNRKRQFAAHLVETLRSPSYKFFAPLQSRPDQQFSPSYNMETVLKPFPHVPQHSPWLVFFSHGKRRRTQTFFSIVEGRSYVKSIPQLSRKTCLLFSHGWLLMTGPETEDCSLCHPTTMETIQLPLLPLENQFPYNNVRCFLSSAPTDPNCVILLAACFKPQIMFCPLSQNTWRKVEYELDNDPGGLYNLVTCNGKLYGMTYDGMLVVVDFDLDPNVLMIEEIPEPSACLMTSRWDRSLVESSGEIFLVYTELTRNTCNVVTFNIYKLDLLEKKWVAVQSIGDKAFFLCKTHSVSCSASESGIRRDSIYYVRPEDPSLYRFDMVDRGICLALPCPNLHAPWYAPSWIFLDELCHSRTVPPSQESLQDPASFENEDLRDHLTLKKVVIKNEWKTEDDATEVGPWSNPFAVVLELIGGRLTLSDRLSMFRVCKIWSSIVCTIPAYNGLSYGFPCLASIDRDGKTCILIDPNCNEMHIKCQNLPSPCIILYSKGGWLLVLHPLDCEEEDESHSIFFFNPLTKTKIDLPNIKFPYRIRSFAFSTPPTSPDCVVIAFHPYLCNISICRRGEREWTNLVDVDDDSLMGDVSPVFCNKSLYCLANDGRLGVFDFSTQVWSVISNETSMRSLISGVKVLHMAESDGELIMVFTDKFGDKVRIQKLDPSKNQWKDIDTIGGRLLFVGCRSSICSKADVLLGDGIYFPRIKDGAFMSYSMEERKFRSGGNFYGSKVFQLGFWIDPVFDSSYKGQIKWTE